MTATAAESAAFPVLQPELIEEMVSCAAPVRRTFKKGEGLYQAGDRDFGFFVIVSGRVEIRDGGDESGVITAYGPGRPIPDAVPPQPVRAASNVTERTVT